MSEFTHFDADGAARMVDVSAKDVTARSATARVSVLMRPATLAMIEERRAGKGDVLGTARLAGIMAAKRTPELIPLCHPLPLTGVTVDLACDPARGAVDIAATCKVERPHRRRDGGADRRRRRRADRLRHVQGGRPRHADHRSAPRPQVRRQVGQLHGRLMLSVADALAAVLNGVAPLPAEIVGLDAAQGRVLAADVAARVTQPPADVSAMDGYAVRAADTLAPPSTLRLIGASAAGRGFGGGLSGGEAVRIFTGAPLPAGADAIVIQEDTEAGQGIVTVNVAATPGRWIRRRGLDHAEGDVALRAGRRLSARDVGLAAGMNVPWLAVRRRPRVAILSTGDEIVLPGEPASADQIFGSNGFAVAGYVRAFGGEPMSLGVAGDRRASLDGFLAGVRGVDLVLTIGGASVGDFDLVRSVLGERGFDPGFYKVAMRPGKPLIYGRLDGTPLLGLPGNPVSAGVTGLVFVKPLIERLLGLAAPETAPRRASARPRPAGQRRAAGLSARYVVARCGRSSGGDAVHRPGQRHADAVRGGRRPRRPAARRACDHGRRRGRDHRLRRTGARLLSRRRRVRCGDRAG